MLLATSGGLLRERRPFKKITFNKSDPSPAPGLGSLLAPRGNAMWRCLFNVTVLLLVPDLYDGSRAADGAVDSPKIPDPITPVSASTPSVPIAIPVTPGI